MASSNKFDLLYNQNCGKRGSHTTATSMDRSANENPILSSLPSMSRSSTSSINVTQGDVNNFFQCLRFDLKSMAAEYKCNRYGDYKRLASAALCAPDDLSSSFKGKLPSSSPEDLKRLKVGLRESTIKARERVKVFSDVLSVINKCFPSIPSRKRSRPDTFAGDRDRTAVIGKMGAQNHALTNAFDYDQHKVEERGKNAIPNKRTRTSLLDQRAEARPNTPGRSSGSIDRDREVVRLPNNNNSLQFEDRTLPIVAPDGWEKTKMKKKRTGIKFDANPSTSSVSSKPIDGNRESPRVQGMHPRNLPDSRPRLNDSNHAFRQGVVNGGGKADGTSQQGNMGMRSSIPRPEQQEITSLLNDKRDQTTNLDQERTNVRTLNKAGVREDFISGTPSSTTKLHTAARGPRTGSGGVITKLPLGQRATVSNGTNKNPGATGTTNRKRTLSTRSSSPPVTQWADRRPQKMSRTARRTNLEIPPLGKGKSDISEKGRRFPVNSPSKQFKLKGENTQSSTLSESEESEAAEIRSREVEEKAGFNVQKMANLVPAIRKNKFIARNVTPGEKRGNVGTAKQLRTGRIDFDKPESKLGRPPTRKLAGRKGYMRQKHSVITPATDYLVASDDGHAELLAAAKAVINPDSVLSSPFWRQMEPLFGFISDADVTYIKQEENIRSSVNTINSIDSSYPDSECSEPLTSGTSPRGVSLCQTLLTALISEEDNNDDYTWYGNGVYGSGFSDSETNLDSNGGFSNFRIIDSTLRSCNEVAHRESDPTVATGFDNCYNGFLDERLLMEIHSLGLYPTRVPDLVHSGDEDVNRDISRLEEKHRQQVLRKKRMLNKLIKSTDEARELQKKEFEQLSLDKLTGMAYRKYMSCWGPNAPGGKGANGKMAKQSALDCVKRTLDRCHEFEQTGKSCFSEPLFKEMFNSELSRLNNAQVDAVIDGESMEKFSGTQASPSLNNHDIMLTHQSEQSQQTIRNDEVWSSRVKKRELYLDDVAGGSSVTPAVVGRAVMNSIKGKRSERDKGNGSKNGAPKPGRPVKGERKSKTKPKQKTTSSINDIIPEQQRTTPFAPSVTNFEEPFDLSHLQLPEMDDFGGQGEDIGSWLNVDEEGLQDDDFLGLEIPMDDLTDLNMMV